MQPKLKKRLKKRKKEYYYKIGTKNEAISFEKTKINKITLNLKIKEIQSFHTFEKPVK